ncbi:MAG: PIG-L family deacetylase [Planctomycetes bacterium]|nr:PIG-L family deacetylase [Planctomycetota bacterium]
MLVKDPDRIGAYDSVYFSPHLDDVAISCPARVLAERRARQKVLVATIFTEGAPDAEARKKEDRKAMALLGVDHVWLGLPDAPWRNPFYRGFRRIVLESHPDDRVFVEERLVPALGGVLARARPKRAYFPFAVGTHIDHRLTTAGALLPGSMEGHAEVLFYEDRPYVFLSQNLRMRLAELDARLASRPEDLAPAPWESLESTLRFGLTQTAYVRAFLKDEGERRRCNEALFHRLRAAQRWEGAGRGFRLNPEVVRAAGAAVSKIRRTVHAYASQIESLFGDDFDGATAAYAGMISPRSKYAERCWRLLP